MNQDLLRYKTRFVTFVLLTGYAFMHVKLTGVYTDASLAKLINFSARLPFGQRLLVPAIAHVLQPWLPFSVEEIFFVLEWLFIVAFFFTLKALMQHYFSQRQALLLSWLFILLLPLMSVVNYRFSTHGEATFFYPCDSATLFFMAAGIFCCLQTRWLLLYLTIAVATFNRESSILLVLLIPALHWQRGAAAIIKPTLIAAAAYILARLCVLWLVQGLPGKIVEWYFRASAHTYFEVNWYWLLQEQHILLFMFCFAALPLLWFALYDYIPPQFRPIRYIAFLYFLALMLVGNFIEARILNELLILLYLPVCLAVTNWLSMAPPYPISLQGVCAYVDRYGILVLLALIILCRYPLNHAVVWLSHCF